MGTSIKNLQTRPSETAGRAIPARPLREGDSSTADHIMRLAFGTFLGRPARASFTGDAGHVPTRWRADPDAAFAAEINDEVVGSHFFQVRQGAARTPAR